MLTSGNKARQSPISFTEVETKLAGKGKVVKGAYITAELSQTKQYIEDLENTLSINKDIIAELVKKNVTSLEFKKIIENLNKENAILIAHLQKTIKERDGVQARLLISDQLVASFRKQEQELLKDSNEEKAELIDQLNRKEFFLQHLERKFEKALTTIKDLSHKEKDVIPILKQLRADKRTEGNVTNVIEMNNHLQTELAKEKQHVKELTTQLLKREPALKNDKAVTAVCEASDKSIKIQVNPSPVLKIRATGNRDERIRALMQENEELKKQMHVLYSVNIKLSEALEEANTKLQVISAKKGLDSDIRKNTPVYEEIVTKPSNRAKSQNRTRARRKEMGWLKESEQGVMSANKGFIDDIEAIEKDFSDLSKTIEKKNSNKEFKLDEANLDKKVLG